MRCTAGFSLNCVQTLQNSTTNEGCTKKLNECVVVFSWNCAQTLPNYEESTSVYETGRKATKVRHSLALNLIK